jgi:hypothetical protein
METMRHNRRRLRKPLKEDIVFKVVVDVSMAVWMVFLLQRVEQYRSRQQI